MKKTYSKKHINFACYITMFLLGLYLAGYQNVIDSVTKEYSIASSIMGLIIALHFIGSITAPVIFGELSDRKGRKVVIVIAFLVLTGGLLLASIFRNIYILALGIFLIGSGFAVIEGTLSTVLSDINPGETVRVINLSQMYLCIGAVLGPLAALFVINQFGSWRALFTLLVFMFFLMALVFTRFDLDGVKDGEGRKETIQIKSEEKIHSLALLKRKNFLLLCLSMFLYVGVEEGIAFWTTTFFGNAYSNPIWGTYSLSAYWAGMIIGRFLAGVFPKKALTFLSVGAFLSSVSIISASLINSKELGFVCFFLTGLGLSVIWPVIVSITSDKFVKYRGTAVGIMMSMGAMGGTVMPFLIGVFDHFGGIRVAFLSLSVLIFVTLLAVLKSDKLEFHI
ncbi:MAG TPA: MFS transporter [Clostridiales bacterium]|nr:MFS transporter [Clostridiales bacterium]